MKSQDEILQPVLKDVLIVLIALLVVVALVITTATRLGGIMPTMQTTAVLFAISLLARIHAEKKQKRLLAAWSEAFTILSLVAFAITSVVFILS